MIYHTYPLYTNNPYHSWNSPRRRRWNKDLSGSKFIWEVTSEYTNRKVEKWQRKEKKTHKACVIKQVSPVSTGVYSHWKPLHSAFTWERRGSWGMYTPAPGSHSLGLILVALIPPVCLSCLTCEWSKLSGPEKALWQIQHWLLGLRLKWSELRDMDQRLTTSATPGFPLHLWPLLLSLFLLLSNPNTGAGVQDSTLCSALSP